MPTNELYPPIEPYREGFLQVSEIHSIYYEEVGNPLGKPILFLHGGPGGGISPRYRQFFDPNYYRIILFDQRGAGKSTPYAELRENTTWDLVSDIEKIRHHLEIDRWLIFGGSWGSTLSLAYALTHPEQVVGMILRGIFLCQKWEIDWFYQEGASNMFPDAWEKYQSVIPYADRKEMVTAYYKLLTGNDNNIREQAAIAWSVWEATTSRLLRDEASIHQMEDVTNALAFARIECHYFINHAFFESDDYLIRRASILQNVPCRIIQGRYDIICPMKNAWDLKKVIPSADLRIIPDAGHSAWEPGTTCELIQATKDFQSISYSRGRF